jgi:hypothetical protein
MAEKFKFVCTQPARLLFSSITQKSAPRTVAGAEPKFSGTFGLEKVDFDLIIPEMVKGITSETGGFSGNPNDYYLACMGGNTAAARVMQKAELDAQALRGQGKNDDAFKALEKAQKRADLYKQYAGILQASSKFDIELAKLYNGAIVDIKSESDRALAGKEMFYSGAYVVPSIALQGFRRKKLDDRDGVTAFLQNVLFIRKGEKIDTGGGPSNSEVFGGFANYSDYDPTANAPGGSNWDNPGNGTGASQSQGAGSSAGGNDQWNQGAGNQGQNGQGGNQGGQNAGNQGGYNPQNGQGGYQPQGGFQGNQGGQQGNDAPQW